MRIDDRLDLSGRSFWRNHHGAGCPHVRDRMGASEILFARLQEVHYCDGLTGVRQVQAGINARICSYSCTIFTNRR